MTEKKKDDDSFAQMDNSPHSQDTIRTEGQGSQQSSVLIKKDAFPKKFKWVIIVSILLLNLGLLAWILLSNGQAGTEYVLDFNQARTDFNFQVYCPISYFPETSTNTTKRYKFGPYEIQPSSIQNTDFKANQTYIINIISGYNDTKIATLQYCGLARKRNESCSSAKKIICTSPGPMFDFLVGQRADVIWINQLNSTTVPSITSSDCINGNGTNVPGYCSLGIQNDQSAKIFKSPNSMHQQNKNENNPPMKITSSNWPSTTHIHGLQIRPQFDGNPLSWVSNSGKRGEGVIPLNKSCYYDNFNNSKNTLPPNIKFTNSVYNLGAKINRYMNIQNPGNLWYHDHAMHLTKYNVGNGLAGIYIIRNPQVQKLLPTGVQQRFLLRTIDGWKDQIIPSLENETDYRYRILNSDISSNTYIRFSSFINCSEGSIPFTIIGADSSLFNTTMPNISQIQLGPAERAQILITFDKSMGQVHICHEKINISDYHNLLAPQNGKSSFRQKIQRGVISYQITARKGNPNIKLNPNLIKYNQELILGVPFTDLSLIEDKDIRVFRMRPLMFNGSSRFMINGHYDFHKGAQENPAVGSIQDWFIINTMGFSHPIHVHLINFQVLEMLKLRTIDNCAFYQMDFLLQAIVLSKFERVRNLLDLFVKEGQIDYKKFCEFYKIGKININETLYIWNDYYNSKDGQGGIDNSTYEVNKQNETDPKTRISGIDVREAIGQNSSYSNIINITNCPLNTTNKYICGQATNDKPWYRRWKDTAVVEGFTVLKYRIRWTKSNYTQGGSFFQTPYDQLIQFPGYIYHCHILGHQDNEMMRSIMLQHPENISIASQPWICHQTKWEHKYQCLNRQCELSEKQHSQVAPSDDNLRRLQGE